VRRIDRVLPAGPCTPWISPGERLIRRLERGDQATMVGAMSLPGGQLLDR
jgi:hypothetical protein